MRLDIVFREPKLHAEQFQVGNTVHMQLLKEMGITVMQTNDGKVQLMHQAGTVSCYNYHDKVYCYYRVDGKFLIAVIVGKQASLHFSVHIFDIPCVCTLCHF